MFLNANKNQVARGALKYDGTINFSKYTLDQNKSRYYYGLNAIVIDSLAYTTFKGDTPIQILQFNILTGEIIHRTELFNQVGQIYNTFTHSIHKVDSVYLLVNSSSRNLQNQTVTQLTLFNRLNDSLYYYFNSYLDYDQHIEDIIVDSTGYILSGYLRKGGAWNIDFEIRPTVIWLDRNFHETKRYVSNTQLNEGAGYDCLIDMEGSILSTNCVSRKYVFVDIYHIDMLRPSIYKLDSTGKFLWQRPMGRKSYFDVHNVFNCLISSNTSDGYIGAGAQTNFSDSIYFSSANHNEFGENLRFEALIAKVSNDGDSLWSRWYYKSDFLFSRSEFHDIISHPDGGYILTGYANKEPLSPGKTEIYTWLLYVDEFGCAVPGCQDIVRTDDPDLPDPIRIYPNPAIHTLYVFQQENEMIRYSITNLEGKTMAEFSSSQGSSTAVIEIDHYPSGQYILTKKDNQGRIRSEKWIKI